MNVSEALDLAIKINEKGTDEGFYAVPYKDSILRKPTYMTNDEWEIFLSAMPTEARNEFINGDGDELSEKDGHPPKMACYGSSSRIIFNLSCGKAGFHFEKKLHTTVGGTANIDGFCDDADRYILVESKCHEPYAKKADLVSESYQQLYEFINARMLGNVLIEMAPTGKKRLMKVDYYADGEKLERFDLKQMICHLLGIATGILKGTLKRKQTDFIYLFYDPTELDIPCDAKEKIDEIYERTRYECNLVDFPELFRVILNYLIETKYAGAMSYDEVNEAVFKFTFTLSSQDSYPFMIR